MTTTASQAEAAESQAPAPVGATIWLTGLPGAGKSTIAEAVHLVLAARDVPAFELDGDVLREGLNSGLDFSSKGRAESVRRASEAALLLARAGLVVLVGLVSPYADDRTAARRRHEEVGVPFLEVWLSTPLEVCESRDPKGLYAKARRGEMRGLTGVDDPYEPAIAPDLELPTHLLSIDECVQQVLVTLERARQATLSTSATISLGPDGQSM